MEKKFLEQWRKSKYLSQTELANQAQVDRSVISRLESGKQSVKLSTAKRIADALGIIPEQIIEFDKLFEIKKSI